MEHPSIDYRLKKVFDELKHENINGLEQVLYEKNL